MSVLFVDPQPEKHERGLAEKGESEVGGEEERGESDGGEVGEGRSVGVEGGGEMPVAVRVRQWRYTVLQNVMCMNQYLYT